MQHELESGFSCDISSIRNDPEVAGWCIEWLPQKMIADAYRDAREIWDRMSEEELAIHGPNETHRKIQDNLIHFGLLDPRPTLEPEPEPEEAEELEVPEIPLTPKRRSRFTLKASVFRNRKKLSNLDEGQSNPSSQSPVSPKCPSPLKSAFGLAISPLKRLTNLRKRANSGPVTRPQDAVKTTHVCVSDPPPPSPSPRIKSRSLSDAQLIIRPRELYTLIEVEEPPVDSTCTDMKPIRKPSKLRRRTIDDPITIRRRWPNVSTPSDPPTTPVPIPQQPADNDQSLPYEDPEPVYVPSPPHWSRALVEDDTSEETEFSILFCVQLMLIDLFVNMMFSIIICVVKYGSALAAIW